MANKKTPRGFVAKREHHQDVTRVEIVPSPCEGMGKHYNPKKRSGINVPKQNSDYLARSRASEAKSLKLTSYEANYICAKVAKVCKHILESSMEITNSMGGIRYASTSCEAQFLDN